MKIFSTFYILSSPMQPYPHLNVFPAKLISHLWNFFAYTWAGNLHPWWKSFIVCEVDTPLAPFSLVMLQEAHGKIIWWYLHVYIKVCLSKSNHRDVFASCALMNILTREVFSCRRIIGINCNVACFCLCL